MKPTNAFSSYLKPAGLVLFLLTPLLGLSSISSAQSASSSKGICKVIVSSVTRQSPAGWCNLSVSKPVTVQKKTVVKSATAKFANGKATCIVSVGSQKVVDEHKGPNCSASLKGVSATVHAE